MDHFYQIRGVGIETEPMLEAYSVLSALAARTSTARLGTLVTGVTYRNPAILAKTVTTLDVISGGRAILGIGAAWNEDEHRGYGVPFPPIGERMDRLDEALTICHAMFTEARPSFTGLHYRIESALNLPRPIHQGGPPVLVGGGGEQRTLRIAAAHADMTHWFPLGLDVLAHKSEVLARYCEAIGRDPAAIEADRASPTTCSKMPCGGTSGNVKLGMWYPNQGCMGDLREICTSAMVITRSCARPTVDASTVSSTDRTTDSAGCCGGLTGYPSRWAGSSVVRAGDF